MSDNFMQYLEERLYQWADWYCRDSNNCLGYPSCSMEYRMMTEGIVSRKIASKPLPTHTCAEEIEALVKEMAIYNANMATALRCQYFLTGSLRVKAAKLKMSHSHFKHCADMAHQWLAGRLSVRG